VLIDPDVTYRPEELRLLAADARRAGDWKTAVSALERLETMAGGAHCLLL
jgi:hypothetical protein